MSDVEKMARAIWMASRPINPAGILNWDAMLDEYKEQWRVYARAALSALGGWEPTHQHRKGGLYRVIARGKLEADLSPVVVYEAKDGTTWVRPEAEFDDGRFTDLRRPATGEG